MVKKDNAAILKLTINDKLVEVMHEIAESKFETTVDGTRSTQCTFVSLTNVSTKKCLRASLYVVLDLSFYGIFLRRESVMEGWCYLCQLLHKEFQNLMFNGNACN